MGGLKPTCCRERVWAFCFQVIPSPMPFYLTNQRSDFPVGTGGEQLRQPERPGVRSTTGNTS